MTRQRSFKRLVRSRMEKTGESYTAARAILLSAEATDGAGGADGTGHPAPVLATSDEVIRQRTGRGWEEWFDLLDEWGAADRTHRDIARWVAEQQDIEPLAWNAQAVTMSYERARRGRAVGQHADGFTVTASRTMAVPVERLYDAFVDEDARGQWLTDGQLHTRTSTRPRRAHFDWGDRGSRVHVTFDAKDEAKSTVYVSHERLADAPTAEAMKLSWRARLTALKAVVEAGEGNA